jgi:hypothetical protein
MESKIERKHQKHKEKLDTIEQTSRHDMQKYQMEN